MRQWHRRRLLGERRPYPRIMRGVHDCLERDRPVQCRWREKVDRRAVLIVIWKRDASAAPITAAVGGGSGSGKSATDKHGQWRRRRNRARRLDSGLQLSRDAPLAPAAPRSAGTTATASLCARSPLRVGCWLAMCAHVALQDVGAAEGAAA